jgi:hypothetical protein
MPSWSSKRLDDGDGKDKANAGNANVCPRLEGFLVCGWNEDLDNGCRAYDDTQRRSHELWGRQSAPGGKRDPSWPTRPQHRDRKGSDKNRAKDKACDLEVRDTPAARPRASTLQWCDRMPCGDSRGCVGVQTRTTIILAAASAKLQRARPFREHGTGSQRLRPLALTCRCNKWGGRRHVRQALFRLWQARERVRGPPRAQRQTERCTLYAAIQTRVQRYDGAAAWRISDH